MSVLMWKVNEDGDKIGQCDARCYNGRVRYKGCICGGENHAVGLEIARMKVRELFRSGKFDKGFRFAPFVKEELLDFVPSLVLDTAD